jgi:hypothetical protein
MTTPEQSQFQTLAWERPLSAQFGNNPEVMRVEVTSPQPQYSERPSLDQLPGVRDYDLQQGMVFYEDGSQASVKTAFARYAAQTVMEQR